MVGKVSRGVAEEIVTPRQKEYEVEPEITKSDILDLLRFEEGVVLVPYLDTEGYPTVGIGHKLSHIKWDSASSWKSISLERARELLVMDLAIVVEAIDGTEVLRNMFYRLSPNRQTIIKSMIFQMGLIGVSKFEKMWLYIGEGKYGSAANEMLDSKWARQTPERATRHADVMASGDFHKIYGDLL